MDVAVGVWHENATMKLSEIKGRRFYIVELRKHEGWYAIFENGEVFREGKHDWSAVVGCMEDVVRVGLVKNSQIFTLPPGHREYIQAKSASAILGGGEIEVLSQYVGYRDGDQVIRLRVSEKTHDVTLEIGPA